NLPHLLFAGPSGTGKTTAAIVLARELYGEQWRENFLELNASDDRGIKMVRETVKEYSRIMPSNTLGFKILFLDEADYMTDEAQAALRRTMENFTKTTRFIISCNYSSKIIEPIQSRTAIFRFKAIPTEDMINLLSSILKNEGREFDRKALEVIGEVSYGDLRKAINMLQVAATYSQKITVNSIYEATGLVRKEWASEVISLALKGDISKAKSMLETAIIKEGISGQDVVEQFHRVIFDMPLEDVLKADILYVLGDIDFRISEGAREVIQLESFLGYLYKKGSK
ncbi:MAG: replication factor C small subunit, partial [Thermoplasmatales archaeon]